MNPDEFETFFGPSGTAYALDNAMLSGAASPAPASDDPVGAPAGAGKSAVAQSSDYVGPDVAIAVLTNQPEPVTDVYDVSTSCDDSSPDEGDADMQGDLDSLFDNASASASGSGSRRRKRRRRRPRHKLECFGCTISIPGTKGATDDKIPLTHMQTMVGMFTQLAPRIEKWTVARMLHAFYKENVYKASQRMGVRVPMWHTHEIYDHFFSHTLAPEVWLMTQLEEYGRISQMLTLSCAERTAGGSGIRPAEKILAIKLRVDAHIRALRREPLDDHNFRAQEGSIDLGDAGEVFARYRDFKRV